jgi:predicted CXXCH cytochrome family protein
MAKTKTKRERSLLTRWRRSWTFVPGLIALAGLGLAVSGMVYAAHLEGSDAFCASCHTQPESQYFDRSQASGPVDLASFHRSKATNCIDCHSGAGVTGRLGAFLVGGHDLIAFVTHTDTQPAPLTVPIGDSHCLKCHADVVQTRDFNRHFHAFLPQWQAQDPNAATCVDCHSAHTLTGAADVMYLVENPTTQVCQTCHNSFRPGRG